MKRTEVQQQKTIIAATPEEWDEKVNAFLETLTGEAEKRPTIERTRTADGFQAIIDYWKVTEEAETIREEYRQKGETYRCQDCPHLRRERDKRYRWLTCEQGMKSCTKETAEACDWFYEQIERARKETK